MGDTMSSGYSAMREAYLKQHRERDKEHNERVYTLQDLPARYFTVKEIKFINSLEIRSEYSQVEIDKVKELHSKVELLSRTIDR